MKTGQASPGFTSGDKEAGILSLGVKEREGWCE